MRPLLPSSGNVSIIFIMVLCMTCLVTGLDLRLIGMERRPHLDNNEAVKFYESLNGVQYQQYIPLHLGNAPSSDFLPTGVHSQEFDRECKAQSMSRATQLAKENAMSIIYVLSHISSDHWFFRKAKQLDMVCVIIVRESVLNLKECPDVYPGTHLSKCRPNEYFLDGGWTEKIYADHDYTKQVIDTCNQKYGWRAIRALRYGLLKLKPGGRWGTRRRRLSEVDDEDNSDQGKDKSA